MLETADLGGFGRKGAAGWVLAASVVRLEVNQNASAHRHQPPPHTHTHTHTHTPLLPGEVDDQSWSTSHPGEAA